MRILFVADGRSPIAIQWMRYFIEQGDEVHLASTFACQPDLPLKSLDVVHVAFSEKKTSTPGTARSKGWLWSARMLGLRTAVRQWLGPLTIPRAALKLRSVIERVQPDIVHAMRIPYEGMLAAEACAPLDVPLLVSIWGNDFTLHAPSTPLMRYHTARTMRAATALHSDCERDVRLAQRWGLDKSRPALVLPGNGGIRTDVFSSSAQAAFAPLVVNPRGFRAYVRNDTFFASIPLVLAQRPDARFACATMAGDRQAIEAVERLGVADKVDLLPARPHAQMAELFRAAQVVVSPSTHDGTPNTLLEAMACGCLPVAGDLESIREWITDGENGLLVDAGNAQALANAILRGLNDPVLRTQAAQQNAAIVAERADYVVNMPKARQFYEQVLKQKQPTR